MLKLLTDNLVEIYEKIMANKSLSFEDGLNLMDSTDLLAIGFLADLVRVRKNGDYVYFTHNLNLNPTNICINRCPLCAFSKDAGDKEAYTLSLKDIESKINWAKAHHLSEFHIVGGLNPGLSLSYYEEILQMIKQEMPNAFIQAFTAVEIDYLSRISGMGIEDVLGRLKKAGLGSIPGGGAEVFSPRVRQIICEKKISGKRWLEIHRLAHQMGIKSNATMLYGHFETKEEQLEHLFSLRELQAETQGFLAFVPLAFHSLNTNFPFLPKTTGFMDIKFIAISRLILDNFPHLRLLWTYVGEKLAQVALNFGVDDLGGTNFEERIAYAAGAKPTQAYNQEDLIRLIKEAKRQPQEVNSLYEDSTG